MKLEFRFTAVYGLHTIQDKRSLWDKFRGLTQIIQGPWLAMGDYNSILTMEDRQNGTPVQDVELVENKHGQTTMSIAGLTWT